SLSGVAGPSCQSALGSARSCCRARQRGRAAECLRRNLRRARPPHRRAGGAVVKREVLAEAIGTAILLASVVGSGIMAERLCGGNVGLALLANAIATGGALYALIVMFGPISGAHFNPVVTLALVWRGLSGRDRVLPFLAAQLIGAILGVWLAHLMFDLSILQASTKVRSGIGQWSAEAVATFGLVLLIVLGVRKQ